MKTQYSYLRAFFSPFKRPKIKFYFGPINIGTPIFYPRKWLKATPKRAKQAALDEIEKIKKWNELSEKYGYVRKIPTFENLYKEKLNNSYAIPKRFGFDFVRLGWKTKWSDTDYRFEWAPLWSFVFFKWQFVVFFIAPEQDYYWTAWLFYTRNTDKTKSKKERIEQCKKEFPLKYSVYTGDKIEKVDYYTKILKNTFL
jgi:hypothetical protein